MNNSDVASHPASSIPLPLRVVLYSATALGLFLPIAFLFSLLWGLQGPFWLYSFDATGAAIQLGITFACGIVLLALGRRLLKMNQKDWWLGGLLAAPWAAIAIAAGISYLNEPDWSWSLAAGLGLAMAAFATAGPTLLPFFEVAWRRAGFSRLSLGRYWFWTAVGVVLAVLAYCGGNH